MVRTMKSLAAVNIRQYERAIASLEVYRSVIDAGWKALFHCGSRLAPAAPAQDAVCLVIASDQGLCGRFNEAVREHALARTPELERDGGLITFWMFGEKLRGAVKETGRVRALYFPAPGNLPAVDTQLGEVVQRIEGVRGGHGIERVYVCHHLLSRSGGNRPASFRLLPLDESWAQTFSEGKWPGRCLPTIGLPPEPMFRQLFRQHLFISLYRAFAHSLACENAARLAAMQAAEKNIREMGDTLLADFRELRQATVTGELLDIISGFEALGEETRPL